MIKFISSIFSLILSCVFAVIFLGPMVSFNSINGEPARLTFHYDPALLMPLVIISMFFIISIISLIVEIIAFVKNNKTKKYGTLCYGIVQDIKSTGLYINEQPEYKAILDIVNPNTNQLERVDENVGFNYNKFPIGSYVLCKYYNGDINFERIAHPSEVSSSLKELLKPIDYVSSVNDVEFSDDQEYVTIDGIKYKKDKW